jgi:hypothetical protein
MGAIFQSLRNTIIAGVVLLAIFIIIAGLGTKDWIRVGEHVWWVSFFCGSRCVPPPGRRSQRAPICRGLRGR